MANGASQVAPSPNKLDKDGRKRSRIARPFTCFLWISLHCIYGLYRVARHLFKRPWRQDIADPLSITLSDLQHEQARWSKLPNHLAVIFTPSVTIMSLARILEWLTFGHWRYVARPSQRLQGLAEDACLLVTWCSSIGIHELTLFDAEGLFLEFGHLFVKIIANYKGIEVPEITSNTFNTLYDGKVTINACCNDQKIRVNLISRQAGRPHLESLDVSDLDSAPDTTDKASVDRAIRHIDKLIQDWLPSPQLLMILGGTHLRLQNFPPWQLSLTEM